MSDETTRTSEPTRRTGRHATPQALKDAHLSEELFFLMARASSIGSSDANHLLGTEGLKVRDYSVLSLACEDRAPSQRELSSFLVLDPSQIVAIVDGLEGRGLVRRTPSETDRRVKLVKATPAGRELLERAHAHSMAATEKSLADLDPVERETLHTLLARVALR